ncbi:YwpF family protein [Salibacterium aidingense]|uniref:YwpF family protein n=1 Tax=Salibacterium aidingense TaxID=384933 RepID=UPI003BBB79A9
MKTFQLVSLHLLLKQKKDIATCEVPLEEGLIINREEKDKSWLIEAVVPTEEEMFFREKMKQGEKMVLEVIITDRHNTPALMTGSIRHIITLEEKISVMLDAKMAAGKDDVSKLILEELIKDGYTGEDMVKEFMNRKEDQVQWSKKAAQQIYQNMSG